MRNDSAATEATLGEPLDFMRLLWAADHGFQSTSKWMLANLGVTASQRLVIRILGRAPDTSAGTLARLLHVHPSTLTGVLQRLEARGLVERHGDPDDGRRAILRLTAAGAELETTLAGTVEAAVARALERLSPRAVASAAHALRVLAEELARR